MTGVYISTVVLSCILGVLLYITNTKVNKKPLFSFLFAIGVMFLIKDYIAARAQLVSFILFVLEILFIECFIDTKKKRYALGLMIIALLIANMHAAVFYFFFILFLPYIAEYLIITIRNANLIYKIRIHNLRYKIATLSRKEGKEEKLLKLQEKLVTVEEGLIEYKEKSKKREENPYRIKLIKRDNAKWLILILILCFVMGLLTPIGDEPYTHIFKLMSGNTTESISEHQPLVLIEHTGAMIVLILLVILLVFTDTKVTLKDMFMIGGLLVMTFMSKRQFSMLATIGSISFTTIVLNFVEKYDKEGVDEFSRMVIDIRGQIVTILMVVLCSYSMYVKKKDNSYINSNSYPVEAANYLLEEAEKGEIDFNDMKLFNDYNYGSYLLYRGIPVFIDSRADLYSPEFNKDVNIFSDYLNISGLSTYYESGFDKYKITHIMTYSNSKLHMLLSRDKKYKEIYKDDHFTIYERLKESKTDE